MAMAPESQVLLADNAAGATNAILMAVTDCDLLGERTFGEDRGKRGTRQEYDCGARILSETIQGGFNIRPTYAELDWLIERAIGDNISGYPAAAATPGESVPALYAFVDKGPSNFRYDVLRINQLTISGSEGDYINVRVDFVGEDETDSVSWPGSPPSMNCGSQFISSDSTFTLDSTAYPFKSFELSINNNINSSQENSVTQSNFEAGSLAIGLNMTMANRSDTEAIYRRAVAGDSGNLALADGTQTYTFTFGNIKIPGSGPTIPEEGEITQDLSMMIKRTTSAQQISIAKA